MQIIRAALIITHILFLGTPLIAEAGDIKDAVRNAGKYQFKLKEHKPGENSGTDGLWVVEKRRSAGIDRVLGTGDDVVSVASDRLRILIDGRNFSAFERDGTQSKDDSGKVKVEGGAVALHLNDGGTVLAARLEGSKRMILRETNVEKPMEEFILSRLAPGPDEESERWLAGKWSGKWGREGVTLEVTGTTMKVTNDLNESARYIFRVYGKRLFLKTDHPSPHSAKFIVGLFPIKRSGQQFSMGKESYTRIPD